ncbi:MAG: hypothetical protein FWD91_07995 [Treponema sp.]|nr:hypothetical protein [Treponema sp.]
MATPKNPADVIINPNPIPINRFLVRFCFLDGTGIAGNGGGGSVGNGVATGGIIGNGTARPGCRAIIVFGN